MGFKKRIHAYKKILFFNNNFIHQQVYNFLIFYKFYDFDNLNLALQSVGKTLYNCRNTLRTANRTRYKERKFYKIPRRYKKTFGFTKKVRVKNRSHFKNNTRYKKRAPKNEASKM